MCHLATTSRAAASDVSGRGKATGRPVAAVDLPILARSLAGARSATRRSMAGDGMSMSTTDPYHDAMNDAHRDHVA